MQKRDAALEFARRAGWASRLPERTREAFLAAGRLRTISEGERLFSMGEPQGPMLFIAEGCLAAEVAPSIKLPNKCMLLYPGAWLAEGPVMMKSRVVGFYATRPSTILMISEADVRRVASVHADLWRWLALLTLENHYRTMGLAHDLMIRGGRRRFAALLARMAGLRDEVVPNPAIIDATQAEVGELVNLARSVVSTFLKEMERNGILRVHWSTVEILRPDLLLELAQAE
jgi:CRP/FNR family transcriptional regulator, cyclic AMP receptor protein